MSIGALDFTTNFIKKSWFEDVWRVPDSRKSSQGNCPAFWRLALTAMMTFLMSKCHEAEDQAHATRSQDSLRATGNAIFFWCSCRCLWETQTNGFLETTPFHWVLTGEKTGNVSLRIAYRKTLLEGQVPQPSTAFEWNTFWSRKPWCFGIWKVEKSSAIYIVHMNRYIHIYIYM